MRNAFIGYYQPTDNEFKDLWENGIFIFDANVLLNLYRYTPKTCNELLSIIEKNNDRVWLPHQAALEYHENRLSVIKKQTDVYKLIIKYFDTLLSQAENELNSYKRHPYLNIEIIKKRIISMTKGIKIYIDGANQKHPDVYLNDMIKEQLTQLFNNKVGEPYSIEKLEKIYKDGESRYKKGTPPGYKDTKKNYDKEYGDLVLWFQIIDYAKVNKKPIIFVTDDKKEDWWMEFNGKIIGPRPELIQEITEHAGVLFYMYQSDSFIRYATKNRNSVDAIKEIQEVRAQNEIADEINRYLQDEINNLATDIEESRSYLANKRFIRHELLTKLENAQNDGSKISANQYNNIVHEIAATDDIIKSTTERIQEKTKKLHTLINNTSYNIQKNT